MRCVKRNFPESKLNTVLAWAKDVRFRLGFKDRGGLLKDKDKEEDEEKNNADIRKN